MKRGEKYIGVMLPVDLVKEAKEKSEREGFKTFTELIQSLLEEYVKRG